MPQIHNRIAVYSIFYPLNTDYMGSALRKGKDSVNYYFTGRGQLRKWKGDGTCNLGYFRVSGYHLALGFRVSDLGFRV